MRLALYQPDIPQNTGAILRTASCLGVAVDIIGPAGFDLSDRALRRAGLDYLDRADFTLHADFDKFVEQRMANEGGRLVLASSHAPQSYLEHRFEAGDVILMGRESAGAPAAVHEAADCRIRIPLRADARSLNLAVASAMILGEALRQLQAFPGG